MCGSRQHVTHGQCVMAYPAMHISWPGFLLARRGVDHTCQLLTPNFILTQTSLGLLKSCLRYRVINDQCYVFVLHSLHFTDTLKEIITFLNTRVSALKPFHFQIERDFQIFLIVLKLKGIATDR